MALNPNPDFDLAWSRQPGRRALPRALVVLVALLLVRPLGAEDAPTGLPTPGPKDVCPVCGMFVALYPAWIATAVYRGGPAVHFDGAKDLFKYLLNHARYAPRRRPEDIVTVAVTEYYELVPIDARGAWYVVGSDVLGPMGHELVPFRSLDDAEAFQKDHRGKAILRFRDVTATLLSRLDEGDFVGLVQ